MSNADIAEQLKTQLDRYKQNLIDGTATTGALRGINDGILKAIKSLEDSPYAPYAEGALEARGLVFSPGPEFIAGVEALIAELEAA